MKILLLGIRITLSTSLNELILWPGLGLWSSVLSLTLLSIYILCYVGWMQMIMRFSCTELSATLLHIWCSFFAFTKYVYLFLMSPEVYKLYCWHPTASMRLQCGVGERIHQCLYCIWIYGANWALFLWINIKHLICNPPIFVVFSILFF